MVWFQNPFKRRTAASLGSSTASSTSGPTRGRSSNSRLKKPIRGASIRNRSNSTTPPPLHSRNRSNSPLPPLGGSAVSPPHPPLSPLIPGLTHRPKTITYTPPPHLPTLPSSRRLSNRRTSLECAVAVMSGFGVEGERKARVFRRKSVGREGEGLGGGMGGFGSEHKRRYTNEQLASALRSLKPVSGPGRSLSTIRSSGSNLFGSADPDLHHFYSPRAVSDLFAEHHFLSKLFYPHKIPGCLRCCMTRSEGYETDPACGYPVVTIEEGGGWRIRVCGDLKREWDEEMGGVGVELEGEQ